MKKMIYNVIVFVLLQLAAIAGVVLWVVWYVFKQNEYQQVLNIAKTVYQNIEATKSGYEAMISGLAILAVIMTGATLMFISYIREWLLHKHKSDFFSAFTHELMTPITCVQMNIETLLNHNNLSDEKKTKLLNAAFNESKRLQSTIDSILDATRIENKKMILKFGKIEISKYLEDKISKVKLQHPDCEIDFVNELSSPTYIYGDEKYLSIALSNIIENAFKYSKDKKYICMKTYIKQKYLNIEIKDEGIGIAKEDLAEIFNLFFRASEEKKGAGLGLYVTQNIIKLHKGQVSAYSDGIGKGSAFTLSLRLGDNQV